MQNKEYHRKRRHVRVRTKVVGTAERPRLVVFRSSRHIYGQLIDDAQGKTVLGVSSSSPSVLENVKEKKGKVGTSKIAGKYLAEKAVKVGVKKVVFDRGGYKYHGRVKAFADGAREGGLEF
jgi:large subunit ribosomal protein L18